MELTPATAIGLAVALVGFEALDRVRYTFAARRGRHAEPDDAAPDGSRSEPRGPVPPLATDLREHVWKWSVPALLVVVVAVEGNSLASIGWRIDSVERLVFQVGVGLAAMIGSNILFAPLWARVGDGGESLAAGLGSFASLSVPERLFVAFTAGATEETAFHGYALERLLALTGNLPLSGGVAFVAFTLGHTGETWDRDAVARIAQPALMTTLLYLWFRSLPALIAIHALNDAVGLLLADRFAAPTDDAPPSESATVETTADGPAAVEPTADGSEPAPSGSEDTDPDALGWLRGE
ncbi:CPBP family intramembrane metalloprotease [Halobellus sp. Atlit-31R]|nr:CPBP family intramembrane metalloprotease [Halobellus sp. Atlit-31R]